MFSISFYIFSILVSYTDCTRYRIPNITLTALLSFLLIFGIFEDKLHYMSFIIVVIIFVLIILIIVKTKIIIGGGDIKYLMLIVIYLDPIQLPLFMIVTGLVQTSFLIYYQQIRKRRFAPMAPAIFLSVIVMDILANYGVYAI